MTARSGGGELPELAKPAKSAGQRLTSALSEDKDTFSIKTLIARAGQTTNWLERLDALINGGQREWLRLKVGSDTVEVSIDNAVREARQLQTELRHILAEIFRQRANLPTSGGDDDDDVLTGL